MSAEDLVELAAGTSRATIDPAMGGRLTHLDLGHGSLLRGHDPTLGWADWGSYPLVPWSNRIPGGELRIGDTRIQLPVNWPDGSAIHGLTATAEWTVVDRAARSVQLTVSIDSEPWHTIGTQRLELAPGRLRQELSLENVGEHAVPAGLGIHPWFRAGSLRVPANRKWPGDPLPVGSPVEVGPDDDLRGGAVPPPMDRCFTELTDDHVEVPGARLRWSGPVTHVVVYTGEPGWMAVEPVTMANDGFGLAARGAEGHGVIMLEPGEQLGVVYEFEAA
jgi:aldose 1-epimerase